MVRAAANRGPRDLAQRRRIITETGLRICKALTPIEKEDVDLENDQIFWIPDSKTPNGVA
jgi:hypothetical protein